MPTDNQSFVEGVGRAYVSGGGRVALALIGGKYALDNGMLLCS